MKMNGYQIREALRRWGLKRDTAASQFDASLKRFDDETDKASPVSVMNSFAFADTKLAVIQVAQDRYNLAVKVPVRFVDGVAREISLAEAVKLVGGAGRAEKMWRSAANPKKERYSYNSDEEVRKEGETRAKPVMTTAQYLAEAEKIARYASSLRAAIALGNGQEVDVEVEGLEPSDLV